jgi:peptidoglycan-associated lipoprotein
MMKFLPVALAAFLVACGTNVPLNNAPVSDAKPTAVAPDASAAVPGSAAPAPAQTVAPVIVPTNDDAMANAEARTVYFDLDSYVVKPEFQNIIANNAKVLRNQPAKKIMIEGHTDEQGGREYNLALGQKRADAVRSALTILGVPASQMESVSYGKEKPAVEGHDEAAWSKNRRAIIRFQ